MSKDNHHNLQCGFGEELVSYLYDEINPADQLKFERHLDKCSNCDAELAAFGFVRSRIVNWREEEFFPLEIPKIKIPYPERQNMVETAATSNNKSSWIKSLRDLFALSPKWATAFAALAVFTGLTVIALNFSSSSDVAVKNQNQPRQSLENAGEINESAPFITEARNNEKELPLPASAQDDQPEKISAPADKDLPKKSGKTVSGKTIKTAKKVRAAKKPNETITAETKETIEKPAVRGTKEVPKLTDFADDEDDTLRLADLFDEIG